MEEIVERFGRPSELRRVQIESLGWLLEAARKLPIRRIVIDGSFTTDRLEPNDVDCALMTGPDISLDHDYDVESLWEIPFLHVLILDPETFDRSVGELFGTDRWNNRKGLIEVTSWN